MKETTNLAAHQPSRVLFPVVDEKENILGIFSMEDIRTLFLEEQIQDLVLAVDIAKPDFEFADPDEDLHSVLKKLNNRIGDEIPVLDSRGRRFMGVIKRRDILNVYGKRLYEIKRAVESS